MWFKTRPLSNRNRLRRSWIYSQSTPNKNPYDKAKKAYNDTSHLRKQLEPVQLSKSIFFFCKKTFIRITRKVDLRSSRYTLSTEISEITAYGSYGTRNKQFLIDVLNEARKMVDEKPSKHINYFVSDQKNQHSSWRKSL